MRPQLRFLIGLLFGIGPWLGIFIGCQSIRPTANSQEFSHEIRHKQIVLHSDSEQEQNEQLAEMLSAHCVSIADRILLPKNEVPIHIYLFDDEKSYYDFLDLRFPGFPSRRAIFVESNVELAIYAHRGKHLVEDLRHEVTHGFLHAALPHLPLWLDEGLAEYFEVDNNRGQNVSHIDFLKGLEDFQPNLARLEQLANAADMTQLDYAESWAWVHFLLESNSHSSQLLTDYLADLQQGDTSMLSARLRQALPGPELTLGVHLRTLR